MSSICAWLKIKSLCIENLDVTLLGMSMRIYASSSTVQFVNKWFLEPDLPKEWLDLVLEFNSLTQWSGFSDLQLSWGLKLHFESISQ